MLHARCLSPARLAVLILVTPGRTGLIDRKLGNRIAVPGIELRIVVSNLAQVRVGFVHQGSYFAKSASLAALISKMMAIRWSWPHLSSFGQVERGEGVVVQRVDGLPGAIHRRKEMNPCSTVSAPKNVPPNRIFLPSVHFPMTALAPCWHSALHRALASLPRSRKLFIPVQESSSV